ncbi:MAG: hypothetical protein ONB24_02780 [candidate division KSB1 bacterium]|nr:hypothetical protein [candidate division KSB1 bacterium]
MDELIGFSCSGETNQPASKKESTKVLRDRRPCLLSSADQKRTAPLQPADLTAR